MNVGSIRPAVLATVISFLSATASPATPQMARVLRVVDGRTLAVTTPAGESLITLAGVELRWADQSVGSISRSAEFLRTSLAGRWVMIEPEMAPSAISPPFWVYRSPDGMDVSREVIRRGLAVLTKQACTRSGALLDAEREARSDLSSGWNDSTSSSGHAMTYLGTIDPPHVTRDKSGAYTTRKAAAKTKSTPKAPIVVVIEGPPSQQ